MHVQALEVNLNPLWYGVLAEIGAGQEVARWFFRVGAAAGTIAKSISAYDMTISDSVYGKADRQAWLVILDSIHMFSVRPFLCMVVYPSLQLCNVTFNQLL